MKQKLRLLCFSILLFNFNASSQTTLTIKMEKIFLINDLGGVTVRTLLQKTLEDYTGIPSFLNPDSVWLSKLVLDREQYWFDKKKENSDEKEYFESRIKEFNIDTTFLSPTRTKSYVGFLTAMHNGKKLIIIDTNNNHDFSDETETYFTFNNKENYDIGGKFNYQSSHFVEYESTDFGKITKLKELIQVLPFEKDYTYKSKIDSIKATYIRVNSYLKGILVYNNESFEISALRFESLYLNQENKNYIFNITPAASKTNQSNWINHNKRFKFKNYVFNIKGFTSHFDSLIIEVRPVKAIEFGGQVGDYMPKSDSLDFSMNTLENKKYTIYNFWGSWCGPCIQEIPDMIKFNESLKNGPFELINIACERKFLDLAKSRQIVYNNAMTWKQQYEVLKDKNSLNELLNVENYPTLIVVDNTGLILDREVGLGNIERIKEKYNIN